MTRSLHSLLLIAALLLAPLLMFAQTHERPVGLVAPSLDVSRLSGSIKIDGDLTDEGWRSAAHVKDFYLSIPQPYEKATVQTEAMIAYDDENLYLAMIAHDPDPSKIRAHLRPRDMIFQDDFMGIILDTYGDGSRAFEIYVNPLGAQGDLLWTSNSEDESYDMIFTPEAKITSEGWQTEMRIPLASLRFPNNAIQNWKATFWRNYPRDITRKFSWAPISFFEPCVFCQFGKLNGITNISSTRGLELLPALVFSQNAYAPTYGAKMVNDSINIHPSLGLSYSFGPNASLEATLNPDFSQVESDAAQVDVNSTTALYYPERRPFFQEGSDLFNTSLGAVYTRSIRDPLWAAKGIYRTSNSSVAYLTAFDRHSPIMIPLEERTVFAEGGRSFSSVLRYIRSFEGNAAIGVLATDRRYQDNASNSVAGADGHALLGNNVELFSSFLFSYTRESIDSSSPEFTHLFNGQHTIGFNGEKLFGHAVDFHLRRFTRKLDLSIQGGEADPLFRVENGFMSSNDWRYVSGWTGYKFPMDSSWITEMRFSISGNKGWNFANQEKNQSITISNNYDLTGQTSLNLFHRWYRERYNNIDFHGMRQFTIDGETRFLPELSFGASGTWGTQIAHSLSRVGDGTDLYLWADFKPMSALSIQPTYIFSQLDTGTEHAYSGSIYRVRCTYQFTREMDVRLVVQYDGFGRSLIVDPLFTYRLNPFSSFYLGSAHNFAALEDQPSHFAPTDRQLFAKFQYLFQM